METFEWNILVVDQNPEDYQTIQAYLAEAKTIIAHLTWATGVETAWVELAKPAYDLVLVGEAVEGGDGIGLIQQAVGRGYPAPFLFLAASGNYETDVRAMQAGAKDYLNTAELTPTLLERSIRYAIEAHKNVRALKDSQERFRLAARAVNGVVYDWDLDTDHIFRSDGLQQVIGVRPSEITTQHGWWEQRVHPEDYPLLEHTIAEKIHGGADAYELEYRVQHLSGQWIDVWERAYVLRDETGKAYRVVGTRTDITDRKRSERNARYLADLGEQMLTLEDPQAMFAYAADALMRHLNLERISFDQVDQAAETITILYERHLHPPAITGMHAFSPFHHELQKRMVKGQAMVVPDTSIDPATAPLYEAAFSKFDFRSFVAIPRLKEEGWVATLSAAVGCVRQWREDEVALIKQTADLTWLAVENARLLSQLREAEERFKIALKNSQMTVYTTDRERRYTWVADTGLNLTGTSILGKRDEEIVNPEDFRELIEAKKSVLATGKGIQRELKVPYQGRAFYLDVIIEPLRGPLNSPGGAMEGLIVAISDKTQRREIEQQVQQTANQLEIQRRMEQLREEERQQIARDLHDGPIQNMIGLMFSLKTVESMLKDSQASQLLVGVEAEAQRLIGDLREVCNELRPPVLVQFGLSSAIRSHANEFQHKHPGLTIHLQISDAGRLLPDKERLALYRIYQEALNNVVRHAQATEATVSLSMVGKTMQLEVTDNGEGFQLPGDMVHLAREGHFGLVGMSERAAAIGGSLRVTSAPGTGTRITVSVPIQQVVEAYN